MKAHKKIAAAIAALAGAAVIVSCSTANASPTIVRNSATGDTSPSISFTIPYPITYAVAGDSISDPTYSAIPATWLNQLMASGRGDLQYTGGLAIHGYTSSQVAAEMPAVDAEVLVIEVGTNDVRLAVPTSTVLANLDKIVAAAGPGVKRVLIVPTPPTDVTGRLQGQMALNKQLEERAMLRRWGYADPFNYVRDTDGTYTSGAAVDGVHGTLQTNMYEMQRFAIVIRQAAGGASF